MLSSSNLVTLATLWMSSVSPGGVEAHRGAWGSSHGHTALMRRSSRRGSSRVMEEHPIAELVRDFFYVPAYPNSLMRQNSFSEESNNKHPNIDVEEDDDGTMHLTMEVPGLSARDLTVELENDHVLRINGIRTRRNKNGYISESKFAQTFRLKDTVDPDRMEANLSSGILTITVPEKPTKVRKLSVSTDEQSILDPPPSSSNKDTKEVPLKAEGTKGTSSEPLDII